MSAPAGPGALANSMVATMAGLVGNWHKQSREECAARYPATLAILADGQYRGESETSGEFTWWDVGTWRLRGDGEVELSTANDALVAYRYRLAGGELILTDPDGCRIVYRAEED